MFMTVASFLGLILLGRTGDIDRDTAGLLGGLGLVGSLCCCGAFAALMLIPIAGMWKAFAKAGEPGWASIVPIYNLIVWCRMAGKPEVWVLLLLIPCVNIVILIIVFMEIAKNFGKDAAFGLGLAFLSFIFWPILGFGSATYIGPRTGSRYQD